MKSEYYQSIINDIEVKLNEYGTIVSQVDSVVKSFYDFDVNYSNEQTVATYISDYLSEILSKHDCIEIKTLNEFRLKLNSKLSDQEAAEIEEEVDGEGNVGKTKVTFIPDTFVSYKTVNKDVDYQLFIEYKIGDILQYIKLASDFLKFKYYTFNSKSKDVTFIYILFNPLNDGMNPTIAHETLEEPKYQILDKKISETDLKDDVTVFFYNYISNNFDLRDEKNDFIKTMMQFQKIDTIVDDIELTMKKADFTNVRDYESNYLYKNKDKFKNNVLVANKIKNKYEEIKILYDALEKKSIEVDVPNDNFISVDKIANFNNVDKVIFVDSLIKYFNNQIRSQTNEDEQKINKFKFNFNKKRSLWILLIIQKFSRDQGFDIDFLDYINSNEKEFSTNVLEELNRNYRRAEDLRNFNQLALGLITYIVELYKEIFDIELNMLKEKKEFSLFKFKRDIIKELNKLNKLLKYRENELNWESDLENEGKKISVHLINLLVKHSE